MKSSTRIVGAVGAAVIALTATAWAQAPPPKKDCPPQPSAAPGQSQTTAPRSLDGQIVAIDPGRGTLTLRTPDGRTHEFRGSRETLNDYKVGDRVALNLRRPADC